ncbi:MAG: type II toxin-antitoxin system prevent-host-death family antitoxin [Gammaproteobacteria bacterium]|nr:type II toxin-antitoxin system prevent-host-death family antitoxin [Gammaproteobacteria bacterium]
MRGHINEQIISHNGVPAFVVVPYEEYQELKKQKATDWWGEDTPHEVVGSIEIDGLSPIKAWRLFLKLTQQQVADRIDMQQSAYSRIENAKTLPKKTTLEKIAKGLGVSLVQLS